MTHPASANAEAIEAWNTVLFDKFVRFRHELTTGLGSHGEAVFGRVPPKPGARVLDIGCGFGDTTLDLARRVGPKGEAVGIDAAPRFVDLASREAKEASARNVRFQVADAQDGDLGGRYDQAFSRFGMMFFANPVAAFRNVRRSLAAGGTLAFCVWRRKDDNPFFQVVEDRVLAIVPHPEKREGQVTCGPGPFSMASPDVVSAQLAASGFGRITFERLDVDICAGATVERAIDMAMAIGPAGEILRLAGEDAARRTPEIAASLRELFASWTRPEGVFGRSSSWVVTATAI